MTHTRSNLIQANEYYPYGMQTANSWTRESNVDNNFLYNGGTELNKTTQVYDLYYRNYDPVLGRFGQVDPMAGSHGPLSPYHFGLNNPTRYNDPQGDDEYDFYMRNNVMNGSYVASGRGNYHDMDPYGRNTGARLMAKSLELQTMQQDAKAMSREDYAAKYGTQGFLFESWTHWYSDRNHMDSYFNGWKIKSASGGVLWSNIVNIIVHPAGISYNLPFPTDAKDQVYENLGHAEIADRSHVIHTDAETNVHIFIDIEMVSDLDPNSTSAFNKNNPGLSAEIVGHELGHDFQFRDVIINTNLKFINEGVAYNGSLQSIFEFAVGSGVGAEGLNNMIGPMKVSITDAVKARRRFEPEASLLGRQLTGCGLEYFNGFRTINWKR